MNGDKVEALESWGGRLYYEALRNLRAAGPDPYRHPPHQKRTCGPEWKPDGTFVSGGLTIDYDKHRVFVDGVDAGLTQNEYKIVSLLGKYAGKVMTYDFIIKEIWGPNMKNDNRILRVNMANIRRKIEKNPAQPQYIFTEVGVGYRIVEPD